MHPYYEQQQRQMLQRARGGAPSGVATALALMGNGNGGGHNGRVDPNFIALVNAIRGGGVNDGIACAPKPGPAIPVGPDGCPQGSLQCKQNIAMNSGSIAAGDSLRFAVLPRSYAQPHQLVYTGPAGSFTIDRAEINGTDYLNGSVDADVWAATNQVDRSIDWAQFSRNTPLFLEITNTSAVAATFTGSLVAAVDRGTA